MNMWHTAADSLKHVKKHNLLLVHLLISHTLRVSHEFKDDTLGGSWKNRLRLSGNEFWLISSVIICTCKSCRTLAIQRCNETAKSATPLACSIACHCRRHNAANIPCNRVHSYVHDRKWIFIVTYYKITSLVISRCIAAVDNSPNN